MIYVGPLSNSIKFKKPILYQFLLNNLKKFLLRLQRIMINTEKATCILAYENIVKIQLIFLIICACFIHMLLLFVKQN